MITENVEETGLTVTQAFKVLEELESLGEESELVKLFIKDFSCYEKALMLNVKMRIPNDRCEEIAREQMIGEAVLADRAKTWFKETKIFLEKFLKQKEQDAKEI